MKYEKDILKNICWKRKLDTYPTFLKNWTLCELVPKWFFTVFPIDYRQSLTLPFFSFFVALGQWTGEQTRNFQIPEVRKCIWDAYIKRVQNLILSFLIQFVFLRNKLRCVWSESDKDYLKEISSYDSFLSLDYEVKCFSFSVTLFRFFKS